MNIYHLSIFIDLAETLNFRKTAFRKNISQPAVSQSIKSIENELTVKLFTRSKSTVKLTTQGQKFYKKIKPLLNSYNKAVQEVRQNEENKETLTIGFTGSPYERNYLPKLLVDFQTQYKNIKVFLQNYNHTELKQQLNSKDCDVVFLTKDDVSVFSNIGYKKLITGYFVAVIPKSNKLAEKHCIDLTDFDHNRIVLLDNGWAPPEQLKLQEIIKSKNKNIDISYVNNVSVADITCQAQLGVSIMPNFIASEESNLTVTRPINYEASLEYGLGFLKGNDIGAVSRFVKFTNQRLENYRCD
ncbi:LysR substrate-binding domain-containing protein [Lactobacillus mulieris]|jgi:transcriptional regulator, lysR family|uniref:LysR substrate-binding domain-containing protein n=1 Tax=Lactobacillus mulieris TaxID=2508708 RepID=UPI0001C039B2|nr:LysR substrate-binding domain-containing protein [Lactobacillus mulieris]EEU21306.2 hypothetical protein HMPREF0525_00240 [Lactobacillus jensenii 27-2-CHN]KAA9370794.1 LysR family transcriptional regulator [Lactobacillus jensenii]MCW8073618.1 LysR substrate-binding domain-containing protein [Lactobacillus mulieris]MCW8106602.1 LysR substrate-binding domain-containing protein [Lactobacillus mulieris]MDK6269217.1 LysR substrate-binding domain-containing protein [Lactobacillus mulieris]